MPNNDPTITTVKPRYVSDEFDLSKVPPTRIDFANLTPKPPQVKNMKNWRTTAAGVVSILVTLLGLIHVFSPEVTASIVTVLLALGHVFAGDAANTKGVSSDE